MLTPENAEAFKNALLPCLEPETGGDGSPVSWRRSYYFESPDFNSYFDHRSNQNQRFKIRMRFYDAKETLPSQGFLEMKIKNSGVILKKRFRFNLDVVRAYLKNENWEDALMHLNEDFDRSSLIQISGEISRKIERLHMRPILFALYGRECLQDRQSGVRITFDSDLYFQATDNDFIRPERNLAFGPKDKIIVEVKTSQEKPTWLNDLIQQFDLKSVSFSKYCYGVEALYLNLFKQPSNVLDPQIAEHKGASNHVGIDKELAHYLQLN